MFEIFRGRRVLVTGHTGFKGSWLAMWLADLGADVVGYALPPPTDPSLFELSRLADSIEHVEGDVRDLGELTSAFGRAQPEVVFHLAAQPLVLRSYREPKETFDTNVGGTVNVLEAIRHCASVKAAVIVTSDKCYENREWTYGYREEDRMGGHDPYSASKGAAELVVAAYRRSFFVSGAHGRSVGVASARAGNVIGGGDFAEDRIIPDAIRAVAAQEPLKLRNPNSTRPWQHVLDPLGAYLLLAERLLTDPVRFSDAFNFGPELTGVTTVKELIDGFYGELGHGSCVDISSQQGAAPHEAQLLRLACDKAHNKLGWQPAFRTEEAIARTAAWYARVTLKGADARTACRHDLRAYEHAREGPSLVARTTGATEKRSKVSVTQ